MTIKGLGISFFLALGAMKASSSTKEVNEPIGLVAFDNHKKEEHKCCWSNIPEKKNVLSFLTLLEQINIRKVATSFLDSVILIEDYEYGSYSLTVKDRFFINTIQSLQRGEAINQDTVASACGYLDGIRYAYCGDKGLQNHFVTKFLQAYPVPFLSSVYRWPYDNQRWLGRLSKRHALTLYNACNEYDSQIKPAIPENFIKNMLKGHLTNDYPFMLELMQINPMAYIIRSFVNSFDPNLNKAITHQPINKSDVRAVKDIVDMLSYTHNLTLTSSQATYLGLNLVYGGEEMSALMLYFFFEQHHKDCSPELISGIANKLKAISKDKVSPFSKTSGKTLELFNMRTSLVGLTALMMIGMKGLWG